MHFKLSWWLSCNYNILQVKGAIHQWRNLEFFLIISVSLFFSITEFFQLEIEIRFAPRIKYILQLRKFSTVIVKFWSGLKFKLFILNSPSICLKNDLISRLNKASLKCRLNSGSMMKKERLDSSKPCIVCVDYQCCKSQTQWCM